MKKRISIIVLSLIMALSCLSFIGCNNNEDNDNTPPTGLTAEQQVQIAKDTYANIYNAIKPATPATASLSNSRAAKNSSDFDYLFDKYPSSTSGNTVTFIGSYYILALPLENLLTTIGASSVTEKYNVVFNFINGEMNYVYPKQINFNGIIFEDSYNKTLATYEMSEELNAPNTYFSLISYYNSDSDFGFECICYMLNDDGSITLQAYYKRDIKTNVDIILMVDSGYYIAMNTTKLIEITSSDMDLVDRELIDNTIQTGYENFINKSTSIEKSNNNNALKSITNSITLDYDVSKLPAY